MTNPKPYGGKYRGEDARPDEQGLIRVNIRISPEMHRRYAHLIPWGIRRNVIEAVLSLILDAVERDGIVVAGAIMDGAFKLEPLYRQTSRVEDAIREASAREPTSVDTENPFLKDDVPAGSTEKGKEESSKDR